jgi:hypothetical protein
MTVIIDKSAPNGSFTINRDSSPNPKKANEKRVLVLSVFNGCEVEFSSETAGHPMIAKKSIVERSRVAAEKP